ncbi:hypothetical protein [Saccharothrix variisporea]|uniref:Uncharacterized protein n=1 Tax=Saccharothrix variisporea TaxID=543527 RepID=A0A495X198_9PSEU|nr:hypothetical protein [Saccharothrix variisporea]RKT67329.1 hypothetical protein DFJ66_0504 [Saccharothrix variisporea]
MRAGGVEPGAGSSLERRYRRLLRVLPAWYRAGREEEMVGIFLADRADTAASGELDLEHGWPGWGEVWATLDLAVRVRFGVARRAGVVVRLVALAGLLGQVVLVGQGLGSLVRFGGAWGWWFDALVAVAVVGVAVRQWGAVKAAAGVLAVQAVVFAQGPWALVPVGLSCVTTVAVVVGWHREAPPVPRARWWAAVVAGLGSGAVWGVVVPLSPVAFGAAAVVTAGVVVGFRPWRAAGSPTR